MLPLFDSDVAAEVNLKTELREHRCFDPARPVGFSNIWRVNNLDVVRFVARHHLIP